jgi:hypothetical protein
VIPSRRASKKLRAIHQRRLPQCRRPALGKAAGPVPFGAAHAAHGVRRLGRAQGPSGLRSRLHCALKVVKQHRRPRISGVGDRKTAHRARPASANMGAPKTLCLEDRIFPGVFCGGLDVAKRAVLAGLDGPHAAAGEFKTTQTRPGERGPQESGLHSSRHPFE